MLHTTERKSRFLSGQYDCYDNYMLKKYMDLCWKCMHEYYM